MVLRLLSQITRNVVSCLWNNRPNLIFCCSLNKSRTQFLNLNLVSLGTLNLQRFSMIRIAIGIWSQKKWNEVVSNVIIECRKKKNILDWECKWMRVTERAFEDVRSLNLPAVLTDQLEFIVEMVGHKLLFYLKYYKNKDCIRVEVIAWTSYGWTSTKPIITSHIDAPSFTLNQPAPSV